MTTLFPYANDHSDTSAVRCRVCTELASWPHFGNEELCSWTCENVALLEQALEDFFGPVEEDRLAEYLAGPSVHPEIYSRKEWEKLNARPRN